jgi:PKD repeat protein
MGKTIFNVMALILVSALVLMMMPQLALADPGPNLTAQGQPASYTYDSTTRQLTINVRVINNGGGLADASTLGYYLSSDSLISTSDCKLGTDFVAALSPGAYSDETITISDICTVGCVSTGTWYVGFIIDETDVVTEDSESDNNWYFTPSISVTTCNQPPDVTVDNETVTVDEGQIAYNSGTWSDPDWVEEGSPSPYPYSWMDSAGNLFTVDATIGDIVIGNRIWDWSYQTVDGPADSQAVTVTATDEYGLTDTASFDLVVNNVAPQVDPISVSDMFIPVGTMIDVSASFTDPGVLDTHTALWDWGDGSTDPVNPATSPVLGNHTYEESGIYTITLCVTDSDGDQSCVTTDIYVLDDYVSGGGSISNPKASVAGIVGNIDGSVAGQFTIVYHGKKGKNTAYKCKNDFTSLVFSGDPIDGPQGPDSSASVATFIGTFVNDKSPSDTFIATITIADVAEPGKTKDTIMIEGGPTLVDTSIKGGNFQVVAN